MGKIDAESQIDFSEDNIFDELSSGMGDNAQPVNTNQVKEEKNLYDHLKLYSSIALWMNVFFFVILLVFLLYNYIQKSEKELTYTLPSFACQVLVGGPRSSSCNGVEFTLEQLKQEIDAEKKKQTQMIIPLIGDLYSFENFRFSKKIAFLMEKSSTRLEPSTILSAFDALKGKFASVDKSELECGNIVIEQPNILKINCDVYASDWDTEIFYFENGVKKTNTVGGGSISKAASFIDYIENDDLSSFKVKTKTQQFTSESVQKPPYTQKTSIELELEYFNTDLLLK